MREFRKLFSLLYRNNIAELMKLMDSKYDAIEWRLSINSSNINFKAVLLNNGSKFSSIHVEHSVEMKESHNSMGHLLSEHKWLICGDLKVV